MPLERKWPGRTCECGVSTVFWHMCIRVIHAPKSVSVWARVSRDVATLHGATPPHDSNCSGGGGVALWQLQRGLELSCSSSPSSALCRREGGTLFLCLDPLPQNPLASLASALCHQCPPAAAF